MPKKTAVAEEWGSKAKAIRQALVENPSLGNSEIARVVKSQFGLDVSASHINVVRQKYELASLSKNGHAQPVPTTVGTTPITHLKAMHELAKALGGVDVLKVAAANYAAIESVASGLGGPDAFKAAVEQYGELAAIML